MPLPPPRLVEQLERLGLANAEQVRRSARRAARLARDLPLFESVWIDALAQRRILTPHQAAELTAGRGDSLVVGPVVITDCLPSLGYAQRYRARRRDDGTLVQLIVYEARSVSEAQRQVALLRQCVCKSRNIESPYVMPINEVGCSASRVWAICNDVDGKPLDEIVARHGRLPAETALEIAQQMVVALMILDGHGVIHGDIAARNVWLDATGRAVLMWPGLRGVLLPSETRSWATPSPTAYDYLAPERIAQGTAPDWASDAYSCGCFWWHLLAGRPPFPGGNRLNKLAAVQQARMVDIRRFAPEAPAELVRAIDWCTRRSPSQRPRHPADLVTLLGPPNHEQQATVARSFSRRIPLLTTAKKRTKVIRGATAARRRDSFFSRYPSSLVATASIVLSGIALWIGTIWWQSPESPSPPLLQINASSATTSTGPPQSKETIAQSGNLNSSTAEPTVDGLSSNNEGLRGSPESKHASQSQRSKHRSNAVSFTTPTDKPFRADVAERSNRGTLSENLDSPQTARLPDGTMSPAREPTESVHHTIVDQPWEHSANVLELPTNQWIPADTLGFASEQVVCGRGGRRATILVDRQGLMVTADDVTFRNIDFVLQDTTSNRHGEPSPPHDLAARGEMENTKEHRHSMGRSDSALHQTSANAVLVRAATPETRFDNCSFTVFGDRIHATAVAWQVRADEQEQKLSLAAWNLEFDNCVFCRVETVIEIPSGAARRVVMNNCLQQQSQTLVRLAAPPKIDEPITLNLAGCTLRDVATLVECKASARPSPAVGRLRIHWADCVFALRSGGAILRLDHHSAFRHSPESITCVGQGSVVVPNVRIVAWEDLTLSSGREVPSATFGSDEGAKSDSAAETTVHVSGLVQSQVGFAGPMDNNPNHSRAIEWQAPRLSDDPPGIKGFDFTLPVP